MGRKRKEPQADLAAWLQALARDMGSAIQTLDRLPDAPIRDQSLLDAIEAVRVQAHHLFLRCDGRLEDAMQEMEAQAVQAPAETPTEPTCRHQWAIIDDGRGPEPRCRLCGALVEG